VVRSNLKIKANNLVQVVPPPISIPFMKACQHLELPPVATYAGVCLWNWRPLFNNERMDSLDNLATHMTFTGSLDESWFYLVSVAIEARAGPIVPMMLEAIAAARRKETNTVVQALRSFAERLDELGALLERMYESCDPHVFYHRIRPFLAGSKNMSDAGLPQGIIFDDGTGTQPYVQFSGGSNAQSSIIQFFDVVLGVEHRPTGESRSTPRVPDAGAVQSPPHGFIQDMRRYMPGPHRRFLEAMQDVANIRDFVNENHADRALTTAYDACLAMLRSLRDKHIQLVSRYIIVKSRETRSLSPQHQVPKAQQRVNLANTTGGKKLRGTGGTALIPFLKQARDETGEPAIDAPGGLNESGKTGKEVVKEGWEIVGLAGAWSVDDSEGGVSLSFLIVWFVMGCVLTKCRFVTGERKVVYASVMIHRRIWKSRVLLRRYFSSYDPLFPEQFSLLWSCSYFYYFGRAVIYPTLLVLLCFLAYVRPQSVAFHWTDLPESSGNTRYNAVSYTANLKSHSPLCSNNAIISTHIRSTQRQALE
jgi:indoleamine 2,3-dioxygenase